MEIGFFFGLMAVSAWVLFLIFQPYLGPLFLAAIFSIAFYPLYKIILVYCKDRKSFSAFLTVLVVLIIVLLPLFIMGALLFQEARDVTMGLQNTTGATGFIQDQLDSIETHIHALVPEAHVSFSTRALTESLASWITNNLGGLFTGVAVGALDLFLMIVGLFFFLRDGDKVRATLIKWSPLQDELDQSILKTVKAAIDSVVTGTLLIAVVQGFLNGLGFWIFGLSSPVLWGFTTAIASLIPGFGTALVWIPGALFLFFVAGKAGMAIGLALWGGLLVGLVDNFLRPILIRRGMKIHSFLILLSVFGGISFFGPIGFLAGPIVLSFAFALIEVYPKIMRAEIKN